MTEKQDSQIRNKPERLYLLHKKKKKEFHYKTTENFSQERNEII